MAQSQKSPLTFTAAAALLAHRLVKLTGDRTVNYAVVGDEDAVIGVTLEDCDSGAVVPVALIGGAETHIVTASEALTQNVELNCDTAGRVQANAAETDRIGRTLAAASGDGSQVEAILSYGVAG